MAAQPSSRRPAQPETPLKLDDAPGLPARRLAATVIDEVLRARVALDETLERILPESGLDAADASLARAIVVTAFRRLGTIQQAIDARLDRGSPRKSGPFEPILTAAAAQILFLDVPDHAAVDLAIRHLHEDARSARYAALGNAVLRRLARERDAVLAEAQAEVFGDTPGWLVESWCTAYGEDTAAAIAQSHREEPPLDLSVKADPAGWAEKLDGIALPIGSVRLRERQAIAGLPGFDEGDWWVQDAAAALPVKLLNPKPGERIADLCAAPGGKTAQLALAGGEVTALDQSGNRLKRLIGNLERLELPVTTIEANMADYRPADLFDAVLLDAPCSSTGTIRRHPDVLWTKGPEDIEKLARLQERLLRHAMTLVKPGGQLVFSNCSLDPSEGEEMVSRVLADNPSWRIDPVDPADWPGLEAAITPRGEFRTTPAMLPATASHAGGVDGFYAVRLRNGA